MKRVARPFTMVRRALWGSDRFMALPDDSCRYLYLYLLTCQHQTSVGCFILKEAYALADLGLTGAAWTISEYQRAKKALKASGLILTDDATGEVLIERWWQDNGPSNEKWFSGARKQCEGIRSEVLRTAALASLESSWAEFCASRNLPSNVQSIRGDGDIPAEERLRTVGRRLGLATP